MEAEKGLVRTSDVRLPKFVEQAYDSIEGMKQFANMLLESKLVPDSYYEKGPDNKPDYTKGKTSAVVIVLLQAQQLAVPPMTGLQHIVPVNGLLSIKGDLAKTMIFASGKLKKDSWVETVTGSIENEDMVVSITATREDNGITTSRSFSVEKAKRMGLWVTSAQANSTDGWKYKKSAWFKTPDRMLFYRCLGNLARDLFSDVLLNMYTTEEAVDIQNDTTTIIETDGGAKITIPDKEHAKSRSSKMTDRVSDKIPDNKFGKVGNENITDAEIVTNANDEVGKTSNKEEDGVILKNQKGETITGSEEVPNESPFTPSKGSLESFGGVTIKRDDDGNIIPEGKEDAVIDGHWTLKQMEDMDTEVLKKIVMDDMDLMEGAEIVGGKNTNKKLRELIFAYQEGNLAEYIAPYLKEKEKENAEKEAGEIPTNKNFDTPPVDNKVQTDIFLSKEPLKKTEEASSNKYSIEVSAEVPRDFSLVKQIFNRMMGVTPQITTPRFMELIAKIGLQDKYADKETFIKQASVDEINSLLNAN